MAENNNNMNESLINNNNDEASQSSLQRQSSLLQRIQAQRQREALDNSNAAAPTSQIQVPQYSPSANNNGDLFAQGAGRLGPGEGNNGFLSEAWNSITSAGNNLGNSSSMFSNPAGERSYTAEYGFDSTDSLIGGEQAQQSYSMSGYFMTFVRDVYGSFLRLPMVVRVVVIAVLLFVAMKLL